MTKSTIEGFPSDGIGVHDGGCAMEIAEDVSTDGALPEERQGLYSSDVAKQSGIEERLSDLAGRLAAVERRPRGTEGREPGPSRKWLKNPAWLAIVVPLVLASLAGTWWVFDRAVDQRIEARLAEPNRRLGEIEKSISRIQGQLDVLIATNTIRDRSQMPANQLGGHLPEIRNSVEALKRNGAAAPSEVLGTIQSKLLKVDTQSPGYWPLVFTLISYRSVLITGINAPPVPVSLFNNFTRWVSA